MGVRTRFYQTLLAFSALGTAGIGIQAHTSFDEYEPLEYGAEQNARIEAYAPLVREYGYVAKTQGEREEAFRELARKWVQGMDSGLLRPLTPIAHEDDLGVPAKQQILAANVSTINGLHKHSVIALANGDYSDALVDAVLAFQTANVLKYSDFDTVGSMALQQRKSMKLVEEAIAHVGPSERQSAIRAVAAAWQVHPGLSRMAQASRRHYVNYLRRMGNPVSPLEENDRQVRYYEGLSEDLSSGEIIRDLKLEKIRRIDPDASAYIADLRFSYSNEWALDRVVNDFLAQSNPSATRPTPVDE